MKLESSQNSVDRTCTAKISIRDMGMGEVLAVAERSIAQSRAVVAANTP
jgi:hypothetical protein